MNRNASSGFPGFSWSVFFYFGFGGKVRNTFGAMVRETRKWAISGSDVYLQICSTIARFFQTISLFEHGQ